MADILITRPGSPRFNRSGSKSTLQDEFVVCPDCMNINVVPAKPETALSCHHCSADVDLKARILLYIRGS